MKYINEIVETLVEEFNTRDPFALCEALGFLVYTAPLPESMNGFYFSPGGYGMICIREGLGRPLDRITCAHELGHALLHPSLNFVFMEKWTQMEVKKYEREADYFCACLLLYPEMVSRLCCDCADCTVQEIACRTGLPELLVQIWLRKNIGDIDIFYRNNS